jgi:hypothetical protein
MPTCVVYLTGACVNGLQELVHLFFGHLLTEVGEDVLQLPDTDEARHVLVKHLEATAVFLWLAGVAETAGPVQYPLEHLEVN